MSNILIIEQPICNRGDEAAHRSLMRSLNKKLPHTKINVLFIYKNSISVGKMSEKHPNNTYINISGKMKGIGRFFPKLFVKSNLTSLAVLFSPYRQFIQFSKKADVIITAPGGMNMGGFQTWSHLFYLILSLKYNKNVVYYSRSIGPFSEKTNDNKVFKSRSREILKRLRFVSLRDARSIQTAKQLGVDCVHSIDTAFLDVPQINLPKELTKIEKNNYIIFVPNSLTWHPTYSTAKQNIIDNLYVYIANYILDQSIDTKIVMLPQLFDSKENDEKYFHNLATKIDNERIIVLPETYSSDIQQKLISQAQLVVGARYHSIVFAINNKVPFIALSYEHKIVGLLEILNLSSQHINVDNIGNDIKDNTIVLQKFAELFHSPIDKRVLCNAQNLANQIAQECFDKAIVS